MARTNAYKDYESAPTNKNFQLIRHTSTQIYFIFAKLIKFSQTKKGSITSVV